MSKPLVLYFSKTGNSKFFAEKTAEVLNAPIQSVQPAIKSMPFLALMTALKLGVSTNISQTDLENCDLIILWSPVWMGSITSPISNVLKKCKKAHKYVHFAVTCETPEAMKNDKYGYQTVLNKVHEEIGSLLLSAEAFSLSMLKNDHETWSPNMAKKPKISESDFQAFYSEKFKNYIGLIQQTDRNLM